ncbi:multicopper oxidase domain-containing protein [Halomontanus rarus]|uniref:multicopper oxidase domain-containing protein n=1 Tax=Halomontanus rarus TaxID=3034020 RepID=UPI001F613B78
MTTDSHAESGMRRRTVLTMAGAGALGALAGCLSPSTDDGSMAAGDEGGDNGSTDDNESADDTAESEGPLTDYPYTAPPQIVELADQGFESTLRTVPARHQLVTDEAKGGPIELPEVWAWQADDLEPSVPGPIYRVTEGETFDLHFENTEHNRSHTVHMHALGKEWKDDGVPSTTMMQVNPDENHTYTYEADVPGTHLYHCHFQTHNHLDMGMYGLVRVDPVDYEAPDREYFLTLREWDDRLHKQEAGGDADYDPAHRDPTLYTVNGRSAPSTFNPELGSPLVVSEGDRVRVHVVNAGYDNHAFHTHNHRFRVVEKDGGMIPAEQQHEMDVVDVAPAERYTLEFTADADPGIYPTHCHKVDHATNDGSYPGGMVTAIVYEEVMNTEEFAAVMDDAGFEG